MSDHAQHGQVGHAVGVRVTVVQRKPLTLRVLPDPEGLAGTRHHRRRQPAGGAAVHELQAVRHELGDAKVIEQGPNGHLERARHDNLPQTAPARLLDERPGSGKDAGTDHVPVEILGERTKPVVRLAPIPLEEEIVEEFAAVEIGGEEEGNPGQRRGGGPETAEETLVVPGVVPEYVDEIRANQGAVEVVERCGFRRPVRSSATCHWGQIIAARPPRRWCDAPPRRVLTYHPRSSTSLEPPVSPMKGARSS